MHLIKHLKGFFRRDGDLTKDIKSFFKGEVDTRDKTLERYSHDTSLFEIKPEAVLYPRSSEDIEHLVKYVTDHKAENPELSITPRSAGTDMGGGAINDSLIVDMTHHFHQMYPIHPEGTWVEPGVFYRHFEKHAHAGGYYLPSFPASKMLCALGGMVSNNSGGEESLVHGKTIDYVTELKVVLSDGKEYSFKKIDKKELASKMKQEDFEGELYRKVYKIVDENYEMIKAAKPHVSKNSTAYNVWDVWDKEFFDMTKLFVGGQGTLGVNTKIQVRLIKAKKYSGLLIIYLDDLKILPHIIKDVVGTKPDSFEAFDDHTLALAIRFIPQFVSILGVAGTFNMAFQFVPDLIGFALKGLPKYTMLVEYESDTESEVAEKISLLHQTLAQYPIKIEEAKTKQKAQNYWVIRHESFNLLRKNVKDKHTAPFIDDLIVPPDHLVEFFPKLTKILEDYKINSTIAGHMGDGNFHIIPLMDLADPKERAKIPVVAKLVNQLVVDFHGSISAEHNDGLIRGPFLEMMYGPKMYKIFKEIKNIFDPLNIFNPHKKTDADMDYSMSHIRQHF